LGRCVATEMHSGFASLRSECPMNLRRSPSPLPLGDETRKEIRRIQEIWRDLRSSFQKEGPYLFGEFSYVDAMFAPVAFRFHHYAIEVSPEVRAYMETLFQLPAIQEWVRAGREEVWVIPGNEK